MAASGVFVTGTGTEAGKTVIASVLARTAATSGRKVTVFKPVVTGIDDIVVTGERPDHTMLREAASSQQSDDEISPYRFGPPVSPHLGAELAHETIDPQRLRDGAAAARSAGEFFVCEGVGGFLVPITREYLIRDFANDLDLPVVVVASPALGTINHTLLTLEAVRGAGLDVAMVVLTPWPSDPEDVERSNRETIGALGAVPVETVPLLDLEDPSSWPELRLPS
jgi:dethiobiotin synthetase